MSAPSTPTPPSPSLADRIANERRGDVCVVGGGLVGAMTAILLGRANYKVNLFEMRQDYRSPKQAKANASSGNSSLHGQLTNTTKRSINLALSHRGLCALRAVGLEKEVLRNSVAMEGRAIHPAGETDAQKIVFQPYEHRPGHAIYSISREELNTVLLDELDKMSNVNMTFNAKFDSIDKDKGAAIYKPFTAMFKSTVGPQTYVQDCKFVVGADGAFSRVREELGRLVRLNFNRQYIDHGYKELCIPALPGGKYAMFANALHIWPRHEFMLIGLPNQDGSFTCTLFMPFEDLDKLKTDDDVIKFFKEYFPDIAADDFKLMPTLLEDFFRNPTSSLLSITCSPWNYKGKMVILGDSSHATVPFYGQGMNAGFEDSLRLFELLQEHNYDTETAFKQFSREMVPSRAGLVEVSLDNYVEMRSKTASPLFALKKKVDSVLSDMIPNWLPLYTMVTFTRIPYHEAIQRAQRQDRILLNALWVGCAALLGGAAAGAFRAVVLRR